MNTIPETHIRRQLMARITGLVLACWMPASVVLAGGKVSYEGIQKVEVFTHMDLPIQRPRKPPFELKVYRMDGFTEANKALDSKAPKGLSRAEHIEWTKNYNKTHPEFENKWTEVIVEAVVGKDRIRRFNTRGRIPAIVINESWVLTGETDVDKAITLYRQQERN